MTTKTIKKDEDLGLELIKTATGFELWSNADDYHGYTEQLLARFSEFDVANFDVANEVFAATQSKRAQARATAYQEAAR